MRKKKPPDKRGNTKNQDCKTRNNKHNNSTLLADLFRRRHYVCKTIALCECGISRWQLKGSLIPPTLIKRSDGNLRTY